MSSHQSSKEIRARLGHPVIDCDGHYIEFGPSIIDYIKRVAGPRVADAFVAPHHRIAAAIGMMPAERCERGLPAEGFWVQPSKNTLDRATGIIPRLLYERLDEFGFDFTVLYPSAGLVVPRIEDNEMRRAVVRAFNMYIADQFRGFADRITPAAIIPMNTPEEAIDELNYSIGTLGLKVAMMGHPVPRPIPEVSREHPEATRWARRMDAFGLDSAYDYDQVWARCVELGVPASFHSGSRGFGFRLSPSNFTYNHIGHFAAALEAICKAIFMGGVTRRFPNLNFAFLEGGVGWACLLYGDLVGHWRKRNRAALEEVNPANLDRALYRGMIERYLGPEILGHYDRGSMKLEGLDNESPPEGHELDDYAACRIERAEDIRDLFVPRFYFGCEADDPMNAWASNTRINPFKAKLKTLLGSDIGHFDVVNMNEVLGEAREPVDEGLITEEDFRDLVLSNPIRFFGDMNPQFFADTAIASAARKLLDNPSAPA